MTKRYWITGGGTGIGAALALLMAKRDNGIYQWSPSCPLEKIASQHPNIHAQMCDVTDPEMVTKTSKKLAGLTGLSSMLGPMILGQVTELTLASLNANAGQLLWQSMPALPDPTFLTHGGHLVLVASLAGLRGLANAAGYGPSKAAVISFAESLRAEL